MLHHRMSFVTTMAACSFFLNFIALSSAIVGVITTSFLPPPESDEELRMLEVCCLGDFNKVGRRLFAKYSQIEESSVFEKGKKLRKFKESTWKCIYYLSAKIFALYVTYDEPWLTNTRNFWIGPGQQVWPDQKINYEIILTPGQGQAPF